MMAVGISDRRHKACDKGEGGMRSPRMAAASWVLLQQVTEIDRDAIVSNNIGGGGGGGEHGGVRGSKRKENK